MLIVLIGPPGAGKSSVGDLLATRLQLPFIEADAVCPAYYAEVGWSANRMLRLADDIGYERAHAAWKEALAYSVEKLFDAAGDAVVALGAGHSHLTRPDLFARVSTALSAADRVVLLRPHPDEIVALDELRKRCVASKGHDWNRDDIDWLARWTTDGRDEQLATDVIYNLGETPAETASRILGLGSAVNR